MNLVTGATGIIGSHVVLKLLQNNKPVIACKQKSSNINKTKQLFGFYNQSHLFEKIVWKDIDICDIFSIEEALEGVTTVYHCAGLVSFNRKDRKKLFLLNETGTANVVNACIEKKIKALCHVSSISTINNSDYKEALHENIFWKTNGKESDYAISKYNGEREVWRGIEEGLNAVIVNPGIVLSPGFWNQSSSRLFKKCYQGNSFYTDGITGYVSAKDTAEAMIQLVEKNHFANRYILIEGNYSFETILNLISTGLSKRKPTIHAGKTLLQFGRILDFILSRFTGREQILTKSFIHSALHKKPYLNTKIKDTLSLKFSPIEAEIKEICDILVKTPPF